MDIKEAINYLQSLDINQPGIDIVLEVQVHVYGIKKEPQLTIMHGTSRHQYNLCRKRNGEACEPCKAVQAAYIKKHR